MARTLGYTVHVLDDKSGELAVFPEGTDEGDIPKALSDKITNPAAWDGEADLSVAPVQPPSGDGEPPRNGAGSGTDVWLAYANGVLGLDLPADAKKADIITAVDEHKAS